MRADAHAPPALEPALSLRPPERTEPAAERPSSTTCWAWRLEGLALFAAATWVYVGLGGRVGLFVGLFWLPKLSLLGVIAGRTAARRAYNAAHTCGGPLALAAAGALARSEVVGLAGLVWLAHIGLDRALGRRPLLLVGRAHEAGAAGAATESGAAAEGSRRPPAEWN